jgi:estrogen-related receptor ERR
MELSLNDQMRLLQSTWAEILTLTLAFRSLPASAGKLRFALDFFLDEKIAREAGAIDLFQHVRTYLLFAEGQESVIFYTTIYIWV